MAEVTLEVGAAAVCRDGFPGELKALVLDPDTRVVTHLVIEPGRGHGAGQGLARLVRLDQADAAADPIQLTLTEAEFKDLPPAEATLAEFVPGYEVPVQLLPAGEGWRGAGGPEADGSTIAQIREMETVALVPDTAAGTPEAEAGRGDHVRAADGDVGEFRALRIEAATGEARQVLVRKHPWGQAEIAIPISAVAGFAAGIQLSLTKAQVKDLAS